MISINCTENAIEFSGSTKDMVAFGKLLLDADNSLQVSLKINPNRYCPIIIKTLSINITDNSAQRIQLEIVNDTLKLNAGIYYIKRLGDNLLSFFDEDVKCHDTLHIFYYAEDSYIVLDNNQFDLFFLNDNKE